MTRVTLWAACAFLLSIAAIVTAGNSSTTPDQCTLHVAWDDYEPYSYADDSGAPAGFDIDVVRRIAGIIGCELTFSEMLWSDILVAIREGDADITVGTGYHEQRTAWSWYSDSYRKENVALLVRRDLATGAGTTSLEELFEAGFVFGQTTDDTYDATMHALFERYPAQVGAPVDEQTNLDRLLDGVIDGFLVERYVGAALIRRHGSRDAVAFHSLNVDAGDYGLQMSRATVTGRDVERINAAIAELRAAGWLDQRLREYDLD